MQRPALTRRTLIGYYCALAAVALIAGGFALSGHRAQSPAGDGTVLLLVAGHDPSRLQAASIDLGREGGWQTLVRDVAVSVPAAPGTGSVAQVAVTSGAYDAVRVGGRVLPAEVRVSPGQVAPVLVAVEAGQPVPDGVYAGSQAVNLALQELSGRLQKAPSFDLLDQYGRPFTSAGIAGHDVVLAAFHTDCTVTCPLYTGLFLQLAGRLPASTTLVEATTDPGTDTPAALRAYAQRIGLSWTLATGTPDQMAAFWKPFGVQLSGAQEHGSTLALIDRHGYIRTYYQGAPDLGGKLPPALAAELSAPGWQELQGHGDGWDAAQVLDALRTIGSTEQLRTAAAQPAPSFDLPGLAGGRVGLADFRGRPLVINFWASWCAPCQSELPMLQQTLGRHPGVGLLLIDERDSAPAASTTVRTLGLRAPVAVDAAGAAGQRYQVAGLPTTVFLRADGSVEGVYAGALAPSALQAHLAAIEAG